MVYLCGLGRWVLGCANVNLFCDTMDKKNVLNSNDTKEKRGDCADNNVWVTLKFRSANIRNIVHWKYIITSKIICIWCVFVCLFLVQIKSWNWVDIFSWLRDNFISFFQHSNTIRKHLSSSKVSTDSKIKERHKFENEHRKIMEFIQYNKKFKGAI